MELTESEANDLVAVLRESIVKPGNLTGPGVIPALNKYPSIRAVFELLKARIEDTISYVN